MNFSQFLSIILARKLIVIWVFFVTVSVTTVVSFLLPKTYTATTTLVVNTKGADPVTGLVLPATLMPGYMATQVDIIASRNVALKVVDKLGVTNSPLAKQQFEKATKGEGDIKDWYADQFLANLDVEPSRESSVIKISYQGADPKFVAVLANTFAEAYIYTNLQLKVEPAKQAAVWFDSQIKGLRLGVETAQDKLSTYQKEHGIVSSDERLDVETARLAELSSQLVAAQGQTYDSNSRQSQLNRSKASESPEILANGLIQNLKAQLVQAEAKFADVAKRLDKNHPQYQIAQGDVTNLTARINEEIAKTSSSIGQTARVSQQREGEIRAALAAQKDHVLKLRSQHDDMAVLVREVENAQRIYDTAMQRYGQTSMEGQSVQTDVSVLNPAIPPLKHSSPKISLNILVSIFLGLLLGVGFAIVAEMLDRRVRTADDLLQQFNLPVLGAFVENKKMAAELIKKFKQFFQSNLMKNKPMPLNALVRSK